MRFLSTPEHDRRRTRAGRCAAILTASALLAGVASSAAADQGAVSSGGTTAAVAVLEAIQLSGPLTGSWVPSRNGARDGVVTVTTTSRAGHTLTVEAETGLSAPAGPVTVSRQPVPSTPGGGIGQDDHVHVVAVSSLQASVVGLSYVVTTL